MNLILPVLTAAMDGPASGPVLTTRQRPGLDVPLISQERLDDRVTAIPARHHQLVRLDVLHQSQFFQIGDHSFAGLEAIQAAIFVGAVVVDFGIGGEDIEQRQLVALADRVVVEIVRRRDLDAAGAEGRIDVFVGNDGNRAARQRQGYMQADQILVALVVGMHGNGGIAQQGFRAGGGDD